VNREAIRSQLSQVTFAQLRAYLLSTGWQQDAEIEGLATIWHRPPREENDAEILLPTKGVAKDYEDRLVDLLLALADYEDRNPEFLVQKLQLLAIDLVSVQVVHHDVENGTIPLDDGVLLNQRARDLMNSAALSTLSKRRHFLGGRPPEAAEYISRLRLGQTKVGSYVVNVLAPVGQPSDHLEHVETTSFSQAVTSNLTSAIRALSEAVSNYEKTKDLCAFDIAVEKGASANMCDALAGFSGNSRGRSFKLSIEPASGGMFAESESYKFYFNARDVRLLGVAAGYYRDNYILNDTVIRGMVKRLDRIPGAEAGSITIATQLIGGQDKNVSVELNGEDYVEAIHAHEAKVVVECRGEVHVSPRSAKLLNPSGFKIFRNGQLFNDA